MKKPIFTETEAYIIPESPPITKDVSKENFLRVHLRQAQLGKDFQNKYKVSTISVRPYLGSIPLGKEVVGSKLHEWKGDKVDFSTDMLDIDIKLIEIPREARLHIKIWGTNNHKKGNQESYVIAWINFQLYNEKGYFKSETIDLQFWPAINNQCGKPEDIDAVNPQPETGINVNMKIFAFGGKIGTVYAFEEQQTDIEYVPVLMTPKKIYSIESILDKDPLHELTEQEKELLWESRYFYKDNPKALSKFLLSVNWANPSQVNQKFFILSIFY